MLYRSSPWCTDLAAFLDLLYHGGNAIGAWHKRGIAFFLSINISISSSINDNDNDHNKLN